MNVNFRPWPGLLMLLILGLTGCQGHIASTHSSPDGRFCVVVRRYTSLIAMPGQTADAPGVIRLYSASGKQLAEVDLPMMQTFHKVQWEDYHVKIVADLKPATWQLPEEFLTVPGYKDPQGKPDGCRAFH